METNRFQVYMVWSQNNFQIFISPEPEFDFGYLRKKGYLRCLVLSPPLPIFKAYFIREELSKQKKHEGIFSFLNSNRTSLEKEVKAKKLKAQKLLQVFKITDFTPYEPGGRGVFTGDLRLDSLKLLNALKGRILLPAEVIKFWQERRESHPSNFWELGQILFLESRAQILPAISLQTDGSLICNRCGQTEKIIKIKCLACLEECYLCENCISLGQAKACLPLFAVPDKVLQEEQLGPKAPNSLRSNLQLEFSLTLAQQDAQREVTQFYRAGKEKICLVWAVCGAGKTEVSFGAIQEALRQGEKVLFAIPRRDVVIELEPRIKKAFPNCKLTALYGGSPLKYEESDIVLATTHQVLRFYKKFSLIILDEADAYPYQGSEMLRFALQRALSEAGKTILMTATPDANLLREVSLGRAKKVTISARHHGYPLPEPRVLISSQLKAKGEEVSLPAKVLAWLHQMVEGQKGQVFIFVPGISLTEKVATALQASLSKKPYAMPQEWIQWSHSKDPARDQKRDAFKQGKYPIMVTTSIMERGITVSKAKVLVLFADYELILDSGTLVQMAGRSGRLEADPRGEVLFVAARETKAIKAACKKIIEMNQEALAKGYLKC